MKTGNCLLLGLALVNGVLGRTLTTTEGYRLASIDTTIFRRTVAEVDESSVVTVTRTATSSELKVTDAAITNCAFINSAYVCVDNSGFAGKLIPTPTSSSDMPKLYTDCHAHDTSTFCVDSSGSEYEFVTQNSKLSTGKLCHFHAGVEHCVGDDESEVVCEKVERDYNKPLRIGLLFVMLVTSAIGVFFPTVFKKVPSFGINSLVFVLVKQFGTGVIISTAFVHLLTHAFLMWNNKCITLSYESTGTAITMAGLFLAFLVEYGSSRILIGNTVIQEKTEEASKEGVESNSVSFNNENETIKKLDLINVLTTEAGILFHSILIGITLVVTADSYFITLFIVIVFHQFFEGLALGSRVAELQYTSMLHKCVMGGAFALITPIGMAIGLGVLEKFNGNNPLTIIALGTLDSLSAGILIWTGIGQWWARDWIHGELRNANMITTITGFVGLIGGLILMSFIGKWA